MHDCFFKSIFLIALVSCSHTFKDKVGDVSDDVLIELIEQTSEAEAGYDYAFLHISDTHGDGYTLDYMVSLLDKGDYAFGLHTGDVVMTESMREIINNSKKPIYIVPGNHDVYDCFESCGQVGFREKILNTCPWAGGVNFGDIGANYYYLDFLDKNNNINRLICLDQYEVDAVGEVPLHHIVMSQKQINWFIDLLEHSQECKTILIAMHTGFGNSRYGSRDFSNKNSFISVTGGNPDSYEYYGDGDPRIIPDIIEAYKTGENISSTYSSGYNDYYLNAVTSFTQPNENFVSYFGGHTHWDVIEYLDYHQTQLQSIISVANYVCPSKYDDVVRESSGINAITINGCYVDCGKHTIQFVRLGARNLIDGTKREEITFKY